MAVQARPDLIGALLTHLRGISEVTDLVSSAAGWKNGSTQPRISGQIQEGWKLPTTAIWLRRSGGFIVGEDFSMGLWTSRVDVICYGNDERLAGRLIDTVLPALCVLQRQPAGFIEGTCLVGSIAPEADVIVDRERDTKYPFAWCPLIVRWLGQAVTP